MALTEEQVKDILTKAFCDTIPAGSIVENSCVLQLLSYNPETGAADYIITFAIVEQDTLEAALADTNNNIAAVIAQNPDVPDAIKNSIEPGTISKCICYLIPLYYVSIFVDFFLPSQQPSIY